MKLSKKIKKIIKLKSKRKLVCLTAYSKPIAKILDKYCDIILVGDSVATAFYGMKSTKEITLDTMITHNNSVKKAIRKSTLVFDMPFNSYRNIKEAKKNIKKIFKKTSCDAVKLESNGKNFNILNKSRPCEFPIISRFFFELSLKTGTPNSYLRILDSSKYFS